MKRVTRGEFSSPYLKILLYGEYGSTKTRTAATAALDERLSPVLMLNSGGNPIAIRDYEKQPDILTLDDLKEYNIPYEWLAGGQDPDHPFCDKFDLNPPYKTVIVDSVTEVQRMSFSFVTGNTRIGPGDIPQSVEIQHFNKTLGQMVTFARLYYGLPMNVIMTSLEKYDKDEVTGAVMHRPLIWGQASSEIGGYAYIVARLVHRARIDNKLRMRADQQAKVGIAEDPIDSETVSVALFEPTGKYVAKDQYGVLGPYMVNPTMTKILDAIGGQS